MESQSRVSAKGTKWMDFWLQICLVCMILVKKVEFILVQASHITRAYHGLHVLCQISPLVNNGEVLLSGNTQKKNFLSPQRELDPWPSSERLDMCLTYKNQTGN